MTIESTLESIDTTLKALLASAQSGAQIAATSDGAPAEKPKRSSKAHAKETPAVAEGDPAGTRYFVIEKHNTVARVLPTETAPAMDGAVEVDAATYLTKKDEFAEKVAASIAAQKPANQAQPEAPATAPASGATVEFKTVIDKLMELVKDTRPGKGREGVMVILSKFLPDTAADARKVPALESLGKNAEILADVEAALAIEKAAEADIFA